ncbi:MULTISPECIES: DUF3006 domain-containing protein [Clostridium]|uniref:DUF3006 domain-containing protein n=1 Tax=Clostridium TaxID=1485 RepID=UPI00069D9682|nr:MULTISPECIES: DUF3006 domain-containing protein [Clostridium]KOF56976.1 pyruvate kinase [Clostridium sp. DMHC 10]MCD2345906.1 DUF3006 domain-containing protein [Clostridium guangxiense]
MKVVIDRFEGNYAVCEKEDRTMINIERNLIPKEAKEQDVLFLKEGMIFIDKNSTKKKKNEIDDLMKDMWK